MNLADDPPIQCDHSLFWVHRDKHQFKLHPQIVSAQADRQLTSEMHARSLKRALGSCVSQIVRMSGKTEHDEHPNRDDKERQTRA